MSRKIMYKGKYVGEVEGDTFITKRDPKKHFFWKYKGYGISKEIISILKEASVKRIRIDTPDKSHSFLLSDYENSNKRWTNNGDEQVFVTIPFNKNKNKKESKLNDFFGGG